MKRLLIVSAVLEFGAGVALMCCPSAMVALLLGSGLDAPAALTLGRMAGAALFSLGLACWLARNDGHGSAARGMVAAMSVYNMAVVAILVYAGLGLGLAGVGLWPAALLHLALAVWCMAVAACVLWQFGDNLGGAATGGGRAADR